MFDYVASEKAYYDTDEKAPICIVTREDLPEEPLKVFFCTYVVLPERSFALFTSILKKYGLVRETRSTRTIYGTKSAWIGKDISCAMSLAKDLEAQGFKIFLNGKDLNGKEF